MHLADVTVMQHYKKVVKKGSFKIAYSRAKKYACEKGDLILTPRNLIMKCKGSWSKIFPIEEVGFEVKDKKLEIYESWYGKPLFRLVLDEPEKWVHEFDKLSSKWIQKVYENGLEVARKRPEELKKLLDIDRDALRKLYNDIRKERLFRIKNFKFNFEIQWLARHLKNRKLKAFIIAHSYVAWYERTKQLLYKIYKAKFGKGPKNDGELLRFLDDYPSWKVLLDTERWGIKSNQIRNCVAHEKFYYDYKPSEIVFIVKINKEKRIRLRELQIVLYPMLHLHSTILGSVREMVTKGEISYRYIP